MEVALLSQVIMMMHMIPLVHISIPLDSTRASHAEHARPHQQLLIHYDSSYVAQLDPGASDRQL